VNYQNVGHLIDQVLKALIFMLALIAFHLHCLCLAVQLDTGFKSDELFLAGVLDIARDQIDLDVGAEHRVAFGEVEPVDVN
jgi:hypothetical protein